MVFDYPSDFVTLQFLKASNRHPAPAAAPFFCLPILELDYDYFLAAYFGAARQLLVIISCLSWITRPITHERFKVVVLVLSVVVLELAAAALLDYSITITPTCSSTLTS